jgi:hypothetical protein
MTTVGSKDFIGIDFTGPFFLNKDPGGTLFTNTRTMMLGIATEGQAVARHNLMVGSSKRDLVSATHDRVADHVVGRVRSVYNKDWWASAVVSVTNMGLDRTNAVSVMAAGSELESRTHTFLNIRRSVRDFRAILQADLTKGLA